MGSIKTILLTGATGYLGSNLSKAFVNNGYSVIVLKRRESNNYRLKDIIDSLKLYDVEDGDKVFEENAIDCIVHTAAAYGKKNETLADIYKANLLFPTSLVDACIKYRIKFFLNTGTSLPANLNTYSLSKNGFSDLLQMQRKQINSTTIKLEYFYGPGDDNTKFVSYVLRNLMLNLPAIDFSEGTQLRDFIYIEDVVNAYLLLVKTMHNNEQQYSEISLGSGKVYSLREVVEKLKHYTNSNSALNFGALPMRDGDVMYSQADLKQLNLLGWQPKYDIDKGLIETVTIEKLLR